MGDKIQKSKVWILLMSILSFIFMSPILGALSVYFGYRNRKKIYAKVGLYIGSVVLILSLIIFLIQISLSPFMIYESCSMYHEESGFEKIFESEVYADNSISLEDSYSWSFQNGINKGDLLIVSDVKEIRKGDIILFNAGMRNPLMHRVVDDVEPYETKGDNYRTNAGQLPVEKNILEDQVIGKVVFRIPFIGWQKLFFAEFGKSPREKGFC